MKKSKQFVGKWFSQVTTLFFLFFLISMSGCMNPALGSAVEDSGSAPESAGLLAEVMVPSIDTADDSDDWLLSTNIYQLYVKSYYDSDGNGVGDLKGVIEKFDYLKKLGVETIWLMPVFEADSYHGYNTNNYYKVRGDYGSNQDLKDLIDLAHDNEMKVILDLVVNHSGINNYFFEQHPDWYCWENQYDNYNDDWTWNNIGSWQKPWGGGSVREWDTRFNRGNFYAVFGWDMPDLNFNNPAVVTEVKNIMSFWINETGVDGYRCDAARYLVEKDGKQKDLYETHQLWKEFRTHIKSVKPSSILLAEAPTETYEQMMGYYGSGDEFDTAFHFILQYNLMNTLKNDQRSGNLMSEIYAVQDSLPSGTQDTIFLSNHDQFAGDRVASQLGGNTAKMKGAASLYLTMSGNPAVYYGEEIGMQGAGTDPELRKWLEWDTIAAMEKNENSLLNHYRKLLHVREYYNSLAGGRSKFVSTKHNNNWDSQNGDSGTLSIIREYFGEMVLVVHNFESYSKNLSVNLAATGFSFPDGMEVHAIMGGDGRGVISSSNKYDYSVGSVGGYCSKMFFLGDISAYESGGRFMTYENALYFEEGDLYSISGTITENGAGVSGIAVSAGGKSGTTGVSGEYTISGLKDGTYQVTPSTSGYTVSPASKSVTVSGANVTAIDFTAVSTPKDGLVIHFYKPADWSGSTVKMHFWDTNSTEDPNTDWPGKTMTPEGDGWYRYQFEEATSTKIVFNNDSSPQTGDLERSGPAGSHHYYKDGEWISVGDYSISGRVTENGSGLSGVTVSAGAASASTDAGGYYTISGLSEGTYSVTPSKSGKTFTPSNKTVVISGSDVTGVDFTAAGGPSGVTVHFAEFESASSYYIHCWDGYSGDYQMKYEGYYNGRHWWVVELPDAPAGFKFCFKSSNGRWDGGNRTYSGQAAEVYSKAWDNTVYTSRP